MVYEPRQVRRVEILNMNVTYSGLSGAYIIHYTMVIILELETFSLYGEVTMTPYKMESINSLETQAAT